MENQVLLVTKIPDIIVELRYLGQNNVCKKPISAYKNPFLPTNVLGQLKLVVDRAETLLSEQANNRKYLREVMWKAGFYQSEHEWWHFDFMGDE